MKLRIGTRGSPLALVQAKEVKQRLLSLTNNEKELDIEIIPIKTSGDAIQDRNLAEIGGKGLFTKEIEEGLLSGDIDLAVHSAKDMPAALPPGLIISGILEREDPRDALISHHYHNIKDLPEKAIVGTSSSRRKAQLLNMRPDLNIINFRGNVQTRLSKIEQGVAEATILAMAGLKRLNIDPKTYHVIEDDHMLPAVAQGAICIETRQDNDAVNHLVRSINHLESEICIQAERSFLFALGADCSTPIAAYAKVTGDSLVIKALIARPDGSIMHSYGLKGSIQDNLVLGNEIGEILLKQAGKDFFGRCNKG